MKILIAVCLMFLPLAAEAKEVSKTAKTYIATRMYTYFSWDRNCKSTPGVVKLITKPLNGILMTNEVEQKITRSRKRPDERSRCFGVPIRGFAVDYVSNAGFKGMDTFKIEVRYRNRPPEIDTFKVKVE